MAHEVFYALRTKNSTYLVKKELHNFGNFKWFIYVQGQFNRILGVINDARGVNCFDRKSGLLIKSVYDDALKHDYIRPVEKIRDAELFKNGLVFARIADLPGFNF